MIDALTSLEFPLSAPSARKQVVTLRKAADGGLRLSATAARFGGESALLASLEHEDETVFNYGVSAFFNLAKATPNTSGNACR